MTRIWSKIIAFILMICCFTGWGMTVNVTSAGSLSSLISIDEKDTITVLEVTGTINASDITFISGLIAIKNVNIEGVTIVGNNLPNNAFAGCSTLETILLPPSLLSIGSNAFKDCSNLKTITIPSSISILKSGVFDNCVSLSDVNLPNTLTNIESSAFYNCKNLSNITIPQTVTSINDDAFQNSGLGSITLPKSVTSIGDNVFANCINLASADIQNPSASLGTGMFYSCENLKTVHLPDSLKILTGGDSYWTGLFGGCTSLSVVNIPSTLESIGGNAFYQCSSLPNIEIPSTVTSIGENAFQECNGLTSIIIPNSVTSLSNAAFVYCKNLQSIVLPKSLSAINNDMFNGCTSLSSIVLPDSPKLIGSNSFKNCTSLASFTIPSSVISIDDNAFENTGLNTITTPKSILSIGNEAFLNCKKLASADITNPSTTLGLAVFAGCIGLSDVKLPDSLTAISGSSSYWDGLFYNCESLTDITIPSTVKTINGNAFADCINLTSISIPSSTTSIGVKAFNNCESLAKVTMTDSIVSIGDGAFQNCASLGSVIVPGKITTINASTFSGCSSLSSVKLSDTLLVIEDNAFTSCESLTSIQLPLTLQVIGESAFESTGLTSLLVPRSVTTVGTDAFNNCENLSKVYFNNPYTILGTSVFYSCANLTEVHLPDSLTMITGGTSYWNGLFSECPNLTSITIPRTVTSIGGYAFNNCKNLLSIVANNPVAVDLSASPKVFNAVNRTACKLIVPEGSIEAYKAAAIWKEFYGIISQQGLSVSKRNFLFTRFGGKDSCSILSTSVWVASCNQPWLSISPLEGTGNNTLTITTSINNTGNVRTAIITINNADNEQVAVAVTQGAGTIQITDTISIKREIADTVISLGTISKKYDLTGYFNTNASYVHYTATSANDGVVSAVVSGNSLGLVPYNTGSTTVTIIATTPQGVIASFSFNVGVSVNTCTMTVEGSITNVDCNGKSSGKVVVSVSGGQAPYAYKWSNTRTDNMIVNMPAGTYTVIVTDTNLCVVTKRFTINEPEAINPGVTITSPACNTSDGVIGLSPSNGVSPYVFKWNNGNTTGTLSNIAAGTYVVTITDAKGCTYHHTTWLSEVGAPELTIDSVVESSCKVANGKIFASATGINEPFTYEWNDAVTTIDRENVSPGTYTLTVVNANHCKSSISVEVPSPSFKQPNIALVTVSKETDHNLVVWLKEKNQENVIDYYNIYQEVNNAGDFVKIGSVPYSKISVYVDLDANPITQSTRYKISATDFCKNESPLSSEYKTINLKQTTTKNNTVYLKWDSYEGAGFLSYVIYRENANGDTIRLRSLPANINRYIDQSPSATEPRYRIGVELPFRIEASALKSDGGPYSFSLSNMAESELISGIDISSQSLNRVYPNPSKGELNILLDTYDGGNASYKILTMQGRLLGQDQLTSGNNKVKFDLEAGIYIVEVFDGTYTTSHKVVKE